MSAHSIDDVADILKAMSKKLEAMSEKLDKLLKNVPEEPKLSSGSLKKRIYDLCNGKRTVSDIINKIRETRAINQSRVSQILSELEQFGLIEAKRGTGDNWRFKYYQQTKAMKTSS